MGSLIIPRTFSTFAPALTTAFWGRVALAPAEILVAVLLVAV
jgi:hypothetical protein